MHDAQMPPFPGDETGFLQQFHPGRILDEFPGIDLSGGKFDQGTAERITELALENEFAAIQHGNHDDGSLMLHILARGFARVRQANPVKADVEELALKNLRTLDRRLGKMGKVFRMWCLHLRTEEKDKRPGGRGVVDSKKYADDQKTMEPVKLVAQRIIRPFGKMPIRATAKPLTDMSSFTSIVALIGTLLAGGSKYMTLTIRK